MSLQEIQRQLKAPKSQWNKFGSYGYRSCEDILEAVKPLLGECVLTLTDHIEMIGDRYYVCATAMFIDGDVSHVVTAYARESLERKGMDDSQITGSASSYARKYALNGLFLVDDTKDADATNTHGKKSSDNGRDGARDSATARKQTDTSEQAQARENIRRWMAEDHDADPERIASRLTDMVGEYRANVDDLSVPELRRVWEALKGNERLRQEKEAK